MIDITDPLAILQSLKKTEPVPVIKTMNPIEIVQSIKCNLCGHEVVPHWLTKHIAMHVDNKYIEEANVRVADSVVRSSTGTSFAPFKEELTEVKQEDVRKFLNFMPLSKVKDVEEYSFRKLKDVSCFSGASKDDRYSDFTMLVWFSDIATTSTYNAGFVGGHNSNYQKASERLQIHLVYDSLERYFTISARIYKRNGYSDYETEESAIPDRICDQEELLVEMRRVFLFFKVPPRATHKRFLKVMKQGSVLIENEGSTPQAVTMNHPGILDELKKAKYTSKAHESDEYSMYHC